MQGIFKGFLVVIGLFLFSFSLNSAPREKGQPIVRDDLPKVYSWYMVSSNKPASELVRGNLVKTFQVATHRQGAVTIDIGNYTDGASEFIFVFNDIEEPSVTITFNKETVAQFLKGADPRADYQEPLKILVRNNILYLGLLKSYFKS